MFEMIGLVFGLILLCGLCAVVGLAFGGAASLLFWGRRRPQALILALALTPLASCAYVVLTAFCLEILVPHNPDYFFGDFSEPLPNGYILTGLGKMPEFSYIDSTPSMMHQPPLRGGIRRLEVDGEVVYGAYGHLSNIDGIQTDQDHGFFIFNTQTGQVIEVADFSKLQAAAGHPLKLVESQLFQSQDPQRILLRRIEESMLFGPPIALLLALTVLIVRKRVQSTQSPAQI